MGTIENSSTLVGHVPAAGEGPFAQQYIMSCPLRSRNTILCKKTIFKNDLSTDETLGWSLTAVPIKINIRK